MALDIRPAAAGDATTVVDILAEATAWLRTRGITQWPDRFPVDTIDATIERGELFVAFSGAAGAAGAAGAEPVATITLAWSDPMFWGDRSDAGFVHRLAVRRSHAGLGSELIAWADRQAAARGRAFLCLDTLSHNGALRAYYERLGFRAVGTVQGPDDHPHSIAHGAWEAVLYERPVAPIAR